MFCPRCTEAFEDRRSVGEMTAEERVTELEDWTGPLEIDFGKVHERIEELVGRPVFTHEMAASKLAYLKHEILTGEQPSVEGVMAKFPHDKPVIAIEVDE